MCCLELFPNQMWQLINFPTGSFWNLGVEKSQWDVSGFIFQYDIILFLSLSIRDFTSTEIFSPILWKRFTFLYLSVLNPAILCNPPSVCICISYHSLQLLPFTMSSTLNRYEELASCHVEYIEVILLVMRNRVILFQVSLFLANQIHWLILQLM